ncbi:alkyl hydroperoxide reductase/ thiol specific antioxidant/ mal allergen [Nitritalea halalkaliphila LW7]|uniref:Alkyl hydroperoxide reductase/ thiol specific antioxidant/ mal allergen n=1 Tax=Nitritalea halalkaliphila LW7 TaxID=1189621 RepID=I5C2C8_9BACT|nr:TlpA disulfide reductase family protein [Nitritalea halalkaliphila]EIM75980.1 alkyl hydroperoxide reductase/ thiol specific antioxidant/ mal allergen [Nitritalea halalkaliphila LW7]
MKKTWTLLLGSLALLFSCSTPSEQEEVAAGASLSGLWLAHIDMPAYSLPFELEFEPSPEGTLVYARNADERLLLDRVDQQGDSLIISMGVFDAGLHLAPQADGTLRGRFTKYDVPGYSWPFRARTKQAADTRFPVHFDPSVDFSGRYRVTFRHENGSSYEAIALLEQEGSLLTGTFLTALGDYRFLEGRVEGDAFRLSTFNGSHLFYFEGNYRDRNNFTGIFRSGPSYLESYSATRDADFQLPDADTLTQLQEGEEQFDFTFPDLEGNPVSLSDPEFANKVVLVTLFGSWCPNCMDETAYLASWLKTQDEREVAVIALAFERKDDFNYAVERVKKSKERFQADFPFLIAGESNKQKAAEKLPQLSAVIAFPTLIYLDRQHRVRKIHTGFSGPGTGEVYTAWTQQHEAFVQRLLAE